MNKQYADPSERNNEIDRYISTEIVDIQLLSSQPYEVHYKSSLPSVGFAFETQTGIHSLGSDQTCIFKAKANSLSFVPGDCDVFSSSEKGGEYLKITLKITHENTYNNIPQFSNFVHTEAIKAAYRLRKTLLTSHSTDMLIIEEYVAKLCGYNLLTGEKDSKSADSAQWITSSRANKIDEYIEEHLEDQLTVEKLAKYCNLSSGFFSRDFKKAFGKSPKDYIIEKRISKARHYLNTYDSGLSEIAFATGFSSHAHMTSVFKQRLGISPSGMRGRSKRFISICK